MRTPEYFSLLISQKKHLAGTGWASNALAIGFIALMAALAAPVEQAHTEAPSAYDKPLPMPTGVEEDPAGWIRPAN